MHHFGKPGISRMESVIAPATHPTDQDIPVVVVEADAVVADAVVAVDAVAAEVPVAEAPTVVAEAPTVVAEVPVAEVPVAADAVIEKGSDYIASHIDVVLDRASVKISVALASNMKSWMRSALKSLARLILGCVTKKLATSPPAPVPEPSTSSVPPSDELPPLEPIPV